MKKNILIFGIIAIFAGILIFNFVRFFWDDDYFGTGGSDTPEEALSEAAKDGPWADEFVVKELVDTYDFGDMVEYLFINQYDNLCIAGVYLGSNGKWNCLTSSVESNFDKLSSFILNGSPDQEINAKYHSYGNTVYGWKLSSTPAILINNQRAGTKTYKIKVNGKDLSIDYWWVDGIQLNNDGAVDSFQYEK